MIEFFEVCDIRCQSDVLVFNPTQSDVHRTEGRKVFCHKNTTLSNHDENRKEDRN